MNDREVVGDTLNTACYLPESFVAVTSLHGNYHDDFSMAVLRQCKKRVGTTAYRGVVLGSRVAPLQIGVSQRFGYENCE